MIFDLDDTLVHELQSAHGAFRAAGEPARDRHGIDPDALRRSVLERCRERWYAHPHHPYAKRIGVSSWEALWARFEGEHEAVRAWREHAPAYRAGSWAAALRDHGVDDPALAEEMAERFPRERRARHVPFPESYGVLSDLRERGYRLGLITNGLSCLQREKMDGTGITPYVDAFAVSGDLGIGKPDPAPFLHLLKRLGVTRDEAIVVGNSLEKDVAGAAAAGIRSVWIHRPDGAETEGDPCAADHRITDLREVRDLLA